MKNNGRFEPDVTVIDEPTQDQMTIDSIRNPGLTDEDIQEIQAEIAEASSNFQKSLEQKDIEKSGIATPVFFAVILILFFLELSRVPEIFKISEKLSLLFDTTSISLEVKGLDDLDLYIREKVLLNFFSESVFHPYLSLAGLKLTLKSANLIKNPYKNFEISEFITEPYDYQSERYERTSRLGLWFYSNGPTDGYSEYFPNMTLEESLMKWREMKSFWVNSKCFISLSVEIVAHCRNTWTTVFYHKTIRRKSSGKFEIEGYSHGISPELFSNSSEEFTSIITIFSLVLFSFIVALLKFLNRYRLICKRFISKFDLSLNLYDYLEVIVIICLFGCIVLFVKLNLVNIGKFDMAFSENEFDRLLEYSREYRVLIRLASLTCLFSLIRLVAFLKIQFPSFGVLFETIRLSKNDLVNICFISAILFCGFVVTGHVAYGTEEESLNSLTSSSLSFFSSMTGNVNFTYCTSSSCDVITIVSILFIAIFYFVLINLFYAVIISTFYSIKTKDRLLISAKTEMLKTKTKGLLKILISFISFNNRPLLYKEAKEYQRLSEMTSSLNFNENQDKLQNIENFIKGQMSINFIQKIKFNLSSLKSFLYSSNLVNQDVYVEQFKKKITEILTKEKTSQKVYFLREFDVEYNFRLLRGLLCYIFLIVFFLVTTIPILRLRESYELCKVNQDFIEKTINDWNSEKSLEQIDSVDDIYDISETIILGLLSESYNWQNYIEFNNSIRITIQFYKVESNPSSFSRKTLPQLITGSTNFSNFRGGVTKYLYLQEPPGDIDSYKGKGGLIGYFIDMPRTQEIFSFMRVDNILLNGKFCAIEWVTTNANLNSLSYNLLFFDIGKNEVIESSFKSVSISPFFHSDKENSITALIVISMVICCYFFIANLIDLVDLWKEINAARLKSLRKHLELDKIIDKICQPNRTDFNSVTTAYSISLVKNFLKNLKNHTFQLFKTFFSYFFLVPFNSIEAASIILTFVTLISLLYINLYKFEINNISDVSFVADYIEYIRKMIAINAMILLFQLPIYLQVSEKISYLIRVMINARLDFMFFTVMFYIILLGFVISGHILLGHNIEGFSSVSKSLFSSYFMQFGLFDQESFKSADSALGLLFIILYIIIIIFFLTTMFTAIISGSYETNPHVSKMSTFQKIIFTLKARWEGKKVIILNQTEETSDSCIRNSIDRIVATIGDEEIFNEEPVLNTFFDSGNFFTALESRLKINKIQLRTNSSEQDFNIKFTDPILLPYINQHIWENTPTSEKVQIWNGLSLQFRNESLFKQEGIFKVYGLEINSEYSELQKELWTQMTSQEKLEMWKGCLSLDGRVDIWLIEEYPEGFFDNWESSGLKERIEIVKKFFEKKGFKQELWKVLSRFSVIRLKLLLSLKKKLHYEVLMIMCILDAIDSPIFIDMLDIHLEEILDDKIFADMQSMSNFLAEMSKMRYISDVRQSSLTECESLINYKKYAESNLSELKKEAKKYERRYRA